MQCQVLPLFLTLSLSHFLYLSFLNNFIYLHSKCCSPILIPPPRVLHFITPHLWLWDGAPLSLLPICSQPSLLHSSWHYTPIPYSPYLGASMIYRSSRSSLTEARQHSPLLLCARKYGASYVCFWVDDLVSGLGLVDSVELSMGLQSPLIPHTFR